MKQLRLIRLSKYNLPSLVSIILRGDYSYKPYKGVGQRHFAFIHGPQPDGATRVQKPKMITNSL